MVSEGLAAQAWGERYGDGVPDVPEIEAIEGFFAHRSIRHFTDRPIPRETIRALIGAAGSAATSSNLQVWSVVSVQEPERRSRLAELVGGQKSVATAAWAFAFLLDLHRLETIAVRTGTQPKALDSTEIALTGVIDAALAAERFVCAAEAMGLGICYIGGLRNHPEAVRDLLGLPPHTFGLFGMAVGWPSEPRASIKPRMRPELFWHEEQYQEPSEAAIAEYEARLAEFNEAHRPGSVTKSWAEQSGVRASDGHMSGREGLLQSLQAQGLFLR